MPPEEAIKQLDLIIADNADFEEAYILRGQKYWSLNQRRQALNDYHSALKINPTSKARMYLEYANSILDFYNKDLLNP